MGRKSVYLETSVISYLAARPSRNLVIAACQQVSAEWWEERRSEYDLFISELVVAEAQAGDTEAAARRLHFLGGIPELLATDEARRLAAALIAEGALPHGAEADALHIAIAAVHATDFLLTWNCRHIDNPSAKPIVRRVCADEGFVCPEVCTPMEITGEAGHG